MPMLIVLRHAKAVAGFGTADIDRVLNDRGRRDAAAAGEWLRANGLVPDHVLCSPAARTRETLGLLALDAAVTYQPAIYANDPDGLLTLVTEAPDDAGTLLLVGHNPSVHQLVHDLTGQAPEAFPTCALAVIDLPDAWAGVRPGLGTLRTVHTPKD
ncbi:SixA phosphatase family protein [Actinomadura bangladeshensis]|uniref:Histidine phosphatase family protein n=1 Tax=Actinomadura bangladeshensis TaxID=453573 RepID=A0A6L9QU98_9ACTN|nr:histidine phosphatase family protein [Actinomadura bangladeshensis]NEA25478.1 histidine phosphatase family protein [Actinomadura bangladeshensis]NEA28193.1 histidine phosphatase family protein [Actinomadura bangladeshensis]